jgi:hypothetical protein
VHGTGTVGSWTRRKSNDGAPAGTRTCSRLSLRLVRRAWHKRTIITIYSVHSTTLRRYMYILTCTMKRVAGAGSDRAHEHACSLVIRSAFCSMYVCMYVCMSHRTTWILCRLLRTYRVHSRLAAPRRSAREAALRQRRTGYGQQLAMTDPPPPWRDLQATSTAQGPKAHGASVFAGRCGFFFPWWAGQAVRHCPHYRPPDLHGDGCLTSTLGSLGSICCTSLAASPAGPTWLRVRHLPLPARPARRISQTQSESRPVTLVLSHITPVACHIPAAS